MDVLGVKEAMNAAAKRSFAQGLVEGRRKGKVAGIRLAVENLRKWAEKARATGEEFEGRCYDCAADGLAEIADKLEEEEG